MIDVKTAYNIAKDNIGEENVITKIFEADTYYIFSRRKKDMRMIIDGASLVVYKETGKTEWIAVRPGSKGLKMIRSAKPVDISSLQQ